MPEKALPAGAYSCEDCTTFHPHSVETVVIRSNSEGNPQAGHPPWMPVALAELGIRRFPPGSINPRIVEYNNHTNLVGYDDKISWCSSFVNWCMTHAGMRGTGSALARSWLEWGRPLERPVYGCIAVLTRDDPASWKGHVGFYLRHDDEHVHLFGGNQLEAVRELAYPVGEVIGYRWPDAD
ncbi:uncharacterized protein (TIGR02594 family) [Burkholderia sp. JKS000303]|nr:uncharacterized protein (TIGR02594 family) [Burkholderia sp. JKS000303]